MGSGRYHHGVWATTCISMPLYKVLMPPNITKFQYIICIITYMLLCSFTFCTSDALFSTCTKERRISCHVSWCMELTVFCVLYMICVGASHICLLADCEICVYCVVLSSNSQLLSSALVQNLVRLVPSW